jgi:hypothetical protein
MSPASLRSPLRGQREIITIEHRPDPATIGTLWRHYEDAFAPLRELALLNHLYDRDSFEKLADDPSVHKVIGWSRGVPVGLGMVTSHLEVVPQISPPFLRRRFPDHGDRNAIFFGILVFVAPHHRSTTMFARIVTGMGQVTAEHDGVIVFDVSHHNQTLGVDEQLERVASWFPSSRFSQIDTQAYYAAELPRPIERSPVVSARRLHEESAEVIAHKGHAVNE